MGLLSEGKSRRKISKDPNNTKWTRDETTFGQKILRAQGWQPGQLLGAENAPHSGLHTAANASYIRAVLKDDVKGLGFQRNKEDEVTGLDVFQDLLSRLNGKTEEDVEADQRARMEVKTNYYVEQRYGPMRFVRGGLLVGDDMRELSLEDKPEESVQKEDKDGEAMDVDVPVTESKKEKKEKKSKKRKATEETENESSSIESDSKKKRRKEERKLKEAELNEDANEKKSKKEKKKKVKSKSTSPEESSEEKEKKKSKKSKKDKTSEDSDEDKAKREKKEKKKEKKRRKEKAEAAESVAAAVVVTDTSTPGGSGTSTPNGSRNFVRSRFIAQKRQAVMDSKALAQIFMIKA